jgi:hypothetical protein
VNPNGTTDLYERVDPAKPSAEDLAELAGLYASAEAEAVFAIVANGETLALLRRPDTMVALRAVYRDAFAAQGLVRFRRDAAGRVNALSVTVDRVWDLRFARQ